MSVSSPLIGQLIENRFLIRSHIGAGGMADVYRASHHMVELEVAVKILKTDSNLTDADIERLKREARALNTLFHPNIVKVYSFGFLESGQPYLVLDYLHGESLEQVIQKSNESENSNFDLDWMLKTFKQISGGLAHAHEQGIVHRDLKPSNIMIIKPEEDGSYVKLLDFGIAKSSSPNDQEQRLTRKGAIFGSPLYMSPEQISGKEVDQQSDIYSLGCLMYEALTGVPPFQGNTVIVTLVKHIQETAPKFSEVTKREIPAELEELVFACMEKDPANRTKTVKDICAVLKQILDA